MYFEDSGLGAVLHFYNLNQMRGKTPCKTKTGAALSRGMNGQTQLVTTYQKMLTADCTQITWKK